MGKDIAENRREAVFFVIGFPSGGDGGSEPPPYGMYTAPTIP